MAWVRVLGCTLVAFAVACAAGDPDIDDNPKTSAASNAATTTGQGASGATGGAGGENTGPCAMDCSAIATPPCLESVCNEGMHQGVIGECVVVPSRAGTACDDGMFCTVEDACDGTGVCQGGPQNDCGMAPDVCKEVSCDEAAMACTQVAGPNGGACQDPNNLCLKGSTCQNGSCIGGTLDDCFFFPVPNDCHVAQCNPLNGMCEAVIGNEGLGCSDPTDLCTVNKTCMAGTCQGGQPKNCSQLTMGCVLGVCDTTSGLCTTQNLMNGDPCDDLNPCTNSETCQNGSCTNGAPVTQCVPNDNCCPMGCNLSNDADCGIFDLDIGPHGSVFSSTLTRGYWFQAPIAFTIKELRVPLEVGNGPQNIQVVKILSGAPPDYPASTTNHQTLGLYQNVNSTNYIVVNIPVAAGDYIGILGARGTTTMANSYATTYFYNTTIFNTTPLTLHRLIYQDVISTMPAGALSNENGGSYGRIELRYGP